MGSRASHQSRCRNSGAAGGHDRGCQGRVGRGLRGQCSQGHRPCLPARPRPGCPQLTWGGAWGPWGDNSGGSGRLRGLRIYLPRLRLPQGPALGLSLRLEGAITLPGEPELEFNAGVGLLQEDLGGGGGGVSHTRELPSDLMAQRPPTHTLPSLPPPPRPLLPNGFFNPTLPDALSEARPHLQEQVFGGGPGGAQRLL